jgi:cation diffusion facilitator CzcD-associated flavoprotein CzcO
MHEQRFDVLIVGAGLSGIGAAYHLQTDCPGKSYAIVEGRDSIGGTWDLFRYPGVRSDSDMYTLGYSFRPWTAPKAIADGPSILEYIRDTARTYGIDKHIRFNLLVRRAFWSTLEAEWTVEAERVGSGDVVRFRCAFLFMCSGYYDYAKGYTPEFPGFERFAGRVVHPQKWTPDIDYDAKKVVVIGSGATAVTLVPEMAKRAAHVTMLQRSPTYVVSAPEQDGFANALRKYVSGRAAYAVTRWKNVLLGMLFFWFCRHYPERAKALLVGGVKAALGPDYPVERDFSPAYDPWDQRVCLVPDGDLFESIKAGRASVVTDQIETFTESGIRLRSGATLEADLIVTATGLNLQVLSDLQITVDGSRVDLAETMAYKGMMFSGVANLALAMGYTNASWTLKCDLTCGYVTRLLNHMAKRGYTQCCPRAGADLPKEPMLDFSSGYVQRSIAKFPKQSTKAPWRLYQNYLLDIFALGYGSLEDGVMEFSSSTRREQELQAAG